MVELRKEEDWKLVTTVCIENNHDVNRILEAAREYAQLMGFGEAETTIVLTSIAELSKNVLGHSARGTVDIRATSKGSKKRLMFTFFNYCLRREDVQQRLCDNVSENRQVRIGLSEKGGMTGEIEIESDFEGGRMIQIRIRKRL